ncbi:gag-protease polyprotein [Trifolium pratense]|uniref:Gag-protease polyprotein n=1 Tax=Trifolium pratense TaxID=57577 RepID=A0A2K3LTR8_TRIPR|nr:gag-protease polyprotein [Trifolium pratense]
MLTRKSENLSMKEDESIHDFYMIVKEYANNFDMLGKNLDDEKLAHYKPYESTQNEKLEKKNKSIAFMSNIDEEEVDFDVDSNDSISEAIVLLGRQFNKVLKRMDRNPRENGRNFIPDANRSAGTQGKTKPDEKTSQSKGIQCHECEGYRHIRAEFPNYLKKQKKSITVSWSDDEVSDNEGDVVSAKQITALTSICASETDSCDEELSYDEFANSYRELCLRSEEVCRNSEKQKEIISQLHVERFNNLSKIDALHKKVNHLTSDLGEAKNVIEKLNTDIWRLRKFSDMLYKDDDHIEGLHKADGRLEEIMEKNVLKPRRIGKVPKQKFRHFSSLCTFWHFSNVFGFQHIFLHNFF